MKIKAKNIRPFRQPIKAFCPRCNKRLLASDIPSYKAVCCFCDENFYDIEIKRGSGHEDEL